MGVPMPYIVRVEYEYSNGKLDEAIEEVTACDAMEAEDIAEQIVLHEHNGDIRIKRTCAITNDPQDTPFYGEYEEAV